MERDLVIWCVFRFVVLCHMCHFGYNFYNFFSHPFVCLFCLSVFHFQYVYNFESTIIYKYAYFEPKFSPILLLSFVLFFKKKVYPYQMCYDYINVCYLFIVLLADGQWSCKRNAAIVFERSIHFLHRSP